MTTMEKFFIAREDVTHLEDCLKDNRYAMEIVNHGETDEQGFFVTLKFHIDQAGMLFYLGRDFQLRNVRMGLDK